MNILTRNKVLIVGIGLILLTNIFVISGAMYNQSGEPEAVLELNERELILNDRHREENSGLSLRLNWNQYIYDVRNYSLLDPVQLEALGFDLVDSDEEDEIWRYINKQLPKPAWVVLEFNGAAYRKVIEEAENKYQEEKQLYSLDPANEGLQNRLKAAKHNLSWIMNSESRLYVVDAGPDPEQLRQQYNDNSQYIIAHGVVSLHFDNHGASGEKIKGYVSEISVSQIHVPLEHRVVFDSLPRKEFSGDGYFHPRSFMPRFQVQLAYGKRYEPWIESVQALE